MIVISKKKKKEIYFKYFVFFFEGMAVDVLLDLSAGLISSNRKRLIDNFCIFNIFIFFYS